MTDLIENYLKRFRKSLDESNSKKDRIIAVVKEITNVQIERSHVELRDGVLNLQIKPIVKSEIVMKKERLLNRLKEFGVFEIK